MKENLHYLTIDEQQLIGSEASLTQNIALLDALKTHESTTIPSDFHWYWSGMQNAAWDTARNTGAIGLMPYDRAQRFAVIYGQQSAVDDQALIYIHDIYRAQAPLQGGRKPSDITPAQIDAMIADTQQAIADLHLLRDLCHSLDRIYDRSENTL